MALAEPVALTSSAQSLRTLSRVDRRLGVVMLAPALIYIGALVGLPFLLAVFLSLTNSSAGSLEFSFVGLQNFASVIRNPVFQRSLKNTFIFTFVSQLTVMVCGNILARALMKRFRAGRSCASSS
jgi:multiple sugar transport system permease protein